MAIMIAILKKSIKIFDKPFKMITSLDICIVMRRGALEKNLGHKCVIAIRITP